MAYGVKKIYPQDVIAVNELLHTDGAAAVTVYKGILVQWDQLLECDRKVFAVIDDMEWKIRMHLLRVLAVQNQLYLLWKSYVSFIPKKYSENAIVDVDVEVGQENGVHGITRPGKFCFIVKDSQIVITDRKV